MEDEKWLPVVGYEGLYEVSDFGRVRSLDRVVTVRASRRLAEHKHKHRGRVLKLITDKRHGYVCVGLHAEGAAKLVRVHRLVLAAFVGPVPTLRKFVNHIDLDRTNNHLSNLEYCTPSENTDHARKLGRLHKWTRGTSTGVHSVEVISRAFDLMSEGVLNGKEIDEELGFRAGFSASLRRGETWLSPPGDDTRPKPIKSTNATVTPGRRRVLTLEDAKEILALAQSRAESQKSIAARYGIHQSTVSNLLTEKSWQGLTSLPSGS